MLYMSEEKIQKNLYLPPWACELLEEIDDSMGRKKQGVIISASLLMFYKSSSQHKMKFIREAQDIELQQAFESAAKSTKKHKEKTA